MNRWIKRASPTRLQRFLDCPAGEFTELPRPEGKDLIQGQLRHRGFELWLSDWSLSMSAAASQAAAEFESRLAAEDIQSAVAQLRKFPARLLPSRECVFVVEGRGLPEGMTWQGKTMDRPLFTVDLDREFGIWGVTDAIDQPASDALRIIDWKGGSVGDPEIQGQCYALLGFELIRRWKLPARRVYFEAISMGGDVFRRAWDLEAEAELRSQMLDLVRRYFDEKGRREHEQRPGGHCRYCPMFMKPDLCKAGNAALQADARVLIPEAEDSLQMVDTQLLLVALAKAEEQQKIVEEVRFRVRAEVMRRVRMGKVVARNGHRWIIRQRRSPKRSWDLQETIGFLIAQGVASDRIPFFMEPVTALLEDLVRDRKSSHTGKGSRDAKRAVDESYRKCFHQDMVDELRREPAEGQPGRIEGQVSDDE